MTIQKILEWWCDLGGRYLCADEDEVIPFLIILAFGALWVVVAAVLLLACGVEKLISNW